ncbi:metal ABC transporter solute-binding protein, Zn/Mn family [Streptomyces sp. TS71-3]|uniref:metal ABC transporter solute-binding protein, Zn/Mn family n=1 Tax=Streptomyces sp. TS71-3 TaxID=2733862 RepID=UPI001B1E65FC|nr:zinc ABC transporter substrate-binding protein [Streptomyces sp. TS71-3]GHJ41224.1 metal ABC transporter substrate-binding protein [Streptomyces sp. TS71-3]
MHHALVRAASAALGVALLAVGASACSTAAPSSAAGTSSDASIRVVAAEDFWGSIARQLGGSHVKVTSIISNPNADPHDYEPTAADGREVATARYAIVNGIGYDTWADKLLAANPEPARTELKVGDLVGIKPGGNPHRWYSPEDVHKVIERITADYKKIDPEHSAYYDHRARTFDDQTLAPYDDLTASLRKTYAGTPIGASESIVVPLAQSLGLRILTPESFLDAINAGTDPTARDKSTIDRQIEDKEIKLYVYDSQNSTPDVRAQVEEAKEAGIPVTAVTETLTPAGASFQDWQVRQLRALKSALAEATGRR